MPALAPAPILLRERELGQAMMATALLSLPLLFGCLSSLLQCGLPDASSDATAFASHVLYFAVAWHCLAQHLHASRNSPYSLSISEKSSTTSSSASSKGAEVLYTAHSCSTKPQPSVRSPGRARAAFAHAWQVTPS